MGSYTLVKNLYKPDIGEKFWGEKVDQNFDILDSGAGSPWNRVGTIISPINEGDSLFLSSTIGSGIGVIYKGTSTFIHDFADITASGQNTFVGLDAGNLTMFGGAYGEGSYNTIVGYNAFHFATYGSNNVALGAQALHNTTDGSDNVAIGHGTLYSNTGGFDNIAIGWSALRYNIGNTGGWDNIAIGSGALYRNTEGYSNIAIGINTLKENTIGYDNIVIGEDAIHYNTEGFDNIALGISAGEYISNGTTHNETSSYSIYLGSNTKSLASGDTNEIVIGYNAIGIGSNTAIIGNNSIITTQLQGNVKIGGAINTPIIVISGEYTATAFDFTILCSAASAGFGIALPTAVGANGRIYVIKKIDSTVNAITVSGYGTQVIENEATMTLETQWATRTIQSDNANWFIIGSE